MPYRTLFSAEPSCVQDHTSIPCYLDNILYSEVTFREGSKGPKSPPPRSHRVCTWEILLTTDHILSKYLVTPRTLAKFSTSAPSDFSWKTAIACSSCLFVCWFTKLKSIYFSDEKKPLDLTNFKRISQNISGWRIFHMSSQMDDLVRNSILS